MSSSRHLLSISGTALVALNKTTPGTSNHWLNWNSAAAKQCFLRKLCGSCVLVAVLSPQQGTNHTGLPNELRGTKWARILLLLCQCMTPNTAAVGQGSGVWGDTGGDQCPCRKSAAVLQWGSMAALILSLAMHFLRPAAQTLTIGLFE